MILTSTGLFQPTDHICFKDQGYSTFISLASKFKSASTPHRHSVREHWIKWILGLASWISPTLKPNYLICKNSNFCLILYLIHVLIIRYSEMKFMNVLNFSSHMGLIFKAIVRKLFYNSIHVVSVNSFSKIYSPIKYQKVWECHTSQDGYYQKDIK